jgi:hypothetical protein
MTNVTWNTRICIFYLLLPPSLLESYFSCKSWFYFLCWANRTRNKSFYAWQLGTVTLRLRDVLNGVTIALPYSLIQSGFFHIFLIWWQKYIQFPKRSNFKALGRKNEDKYCIVAVTNASYNRRSSQLENKLVDPLRYDAKSTPIECAGRGWVEQREICQ